MLVVALYDWEAQILSFMKDNTQKHILCFHTEEEARATVLTAGITEQELNLAIETGEIQLIHEGEKWYYPL